MRSYVSCILVSSDGDIILQLRDNNPDIVDPNCLSLFAGAMEPGETRDQSIHREILEETTLDLNDLKYLFTWQEPGTDHESHVYYRDNIDLNDVDVREGQGYRLIRTRTDLANHDFAGISKNILAKYFDEYNTANL